MPSDRIQWLVDVCFAGTASAEESEELATWVGQAANDEILRDLLKEAWDRHEPSALMPDDMSRRIMASVLQPRARLRLLRPIRWAAAAAILLLLVSGGWLWLKNRRGAPYEPTRSLAIHDIAPGGDKAILTLANGQKIILDSAANGLVAQEGNANIQKPAEGLLTYKNESNKSLQSGESWSNTLTTPRGGQYQLVLPDGSKVWLNAASSIRYPTAFTGKTRNVEISGEAYFEIAKDPAMPFHVKTGKADIAVLGTAFDIMAYGDEDAIRTTLVEGLVNVSSGAETRRLEPGRVAVLPKDHPTIMIQEADTAIALAWKNGLFRFKDANIQDIMRQVSRWYGLDVEYQGTVTDHFIASIPRNTTLSGTFRILEQTGGVHFRIEGKKIIVMP